MEQTLSWHDRIKMENETKAALCQQKLAAVLSVPRPIVEPLATRSDSVRVIIDRSKGSRLNIKA